MMSVLTVNLRVVQRGAALLAEHVRHHFKTFWGCVCLHHAAQSAAGTMLAY